MVISFSIYNLLLYSVVLLFVVVLVCHLISRFYQDKEKNTMNLEDFIADSIVQLMNGVTKAQNISEVVGGAVNPHILPTSDSSVMPSISHGNTTEIKYNLALSKSKGQDGKSNFSVMFGEYGGIGKQIDKHHLDSSMTSMSFSILVSLPLHDFRATQNFSMDELKAVEKVRKDKAKNLKNGKV